MSDIVEVAIMNINLSEGAARIAVAPRRQELNRTTKQ